MGKNSRFVCVCNGMFMRALKSRNAYISLAVTLGVMIAYKRTLTFNFKIGIYFIMGRKKTFLSGGKLGKLNNI